MTNEALGILSAAARLGRPLDLLTPSPLLPEPPLLKLTISVLPSVLVLPLLLLPPLLLLKEEEEAGGGGGGGGVLSLCAVWLPPRVVGAVRGLPVGTGGLV